MNKLARFAVTIVSNEMQRAIQICLIALMTLVLSGCGRSYHIKGRVIILPQLQSSNGFILEFTGKDFPNGGSPVSRAMVKMMHDLDKADRPKEGSAWEHDTVTDENGYFDTSDYAAPVKEAKVGLEVSKEGYKTVYTTYIDYSDIEPQVFFVVLAMDARTNNALNLTYR